MIRVLVVDDDALVAKVHSAWVARVPHFQVVGVAHTATDARAAVRAQRPDLLLLDIYLPDQNGLDLLLQLRQEIADVDALVITAARDADTVQRAFRQGAVHYIVKPFDYDVLRERLEHYATRHRGLPETVQQHDVDALYEGPVHRTERLPKGLAPETARLVEKALRECPTDMSAAECGNVTGLSRVSARRYLEFLAAAGHATCTLRYGSAGRPERRYRWVG